MSQHPRRHDLLYTIGPRPAPLHAVEAARRLQSDFHTVPSCIELHLALLAQEAASEEILDGPRSVVGKVHNHLPVKQELTATIRAQVHSVNTAISVYLTLPGDTMRSRRGERHEVGIPLCGRPEKWLEGRALLLI